MDLGTGLARVGVSYIVRRPRFWIRRPPLLGNGQQAPRSEEGRGQRAGVTAKEVKGVQVWRNGQERMSARCVSRRLGESQSKDVKPTICKSGWHSKSWRGAFSHSWTFASALVRFVGSCFTVRPRKPRKGCLALSVDGLPFRSGRCRPKHVFWDCCLHHLGRERFFMLSHSKPITKGTTLERKNTPMQLIDLVTKTRFQCRPYCMHFTVDVVFSIFHTFRRLFCWNCLKRLSACFVICRYDFAVFLFSSLAVLFELSQIWILEISRMMLHTSSSVTKVTPKRRASPRACGSVLLVVRRSHGGGTGIKRML